MLPQVPTQRNHLAVVGIGGKVYVAGGRFGGGFNSERTAALEIFDPATDTWHSLPPMPTPTHGLVGAAFVNGRIHIPGGSATIDGGTGTVIHQVYRPTLSCA